MGALVSLNPWSSYAGVHVMITGGSSGIGLEAAREYLRRGAHVTLVARDQSRLDAAEASLRKSMSSKGFYVEIISPVNQKIVTVSVDVSDEESVKKSFQKCVDLLGPIEILVTCAGTSLSNAFEDTKIQDFEMLYKANVLGSVIPAKYVIPSMKTRKRGRIVFLSSQAALVGIHGYSAYGASKISLKSIAEVLQMELRPYNIFVSISYPPDTNTPGYVEEMKSKPSITKKLSESGTVFSPSQVAKAIVDGSSAGCFSISIGLDGWLLQQAHPGLSPINNIWEVIQGILFSPIARLISIFYLLYWDYVCNKFAFEAQPVDDSRLAFEACEAWSGAREGKVFKRGTQGLGYYEDARAPTVDAANDQASAKKSKDD